MLEPRTIHEVMRSDADKGGHFFDAETLEFFKSIVYDPVYTGEDGWYFVTSERAPSSPRRYTVRIQEPSGYVHSVEGFQNFASAPTAHEHAERLAAGGQA